MAGNFKQLVTELRIMVDAIMERCAKAESRVVELEAEVEQHKTRIAELEKANGELTSRYNDLKAGLSQGQSPEEVARLKDRYLAMISEIDECIAKLEHNGR